MSDSVGEQPLGFDVGVYSLDGTTFIDKLNDYLIGYGHTIQAMGGFWDARLSLLMPTELALYWNEKLMGKRIKMVAGITEEIFTGVVNNQSINSGTLTDTRGPLLGIGNRLCTVYSPTDYTVYPPVSGTETVTPIKENLASQKKYGIIEKILSSGQTSPENAEQNVDIFLRDKGEPESSGNFSIQAGGGQFTQLGIDLVGLGQFALQCYVYNNYTAGFQYVSDKIKAIFGADPNGYLSTDYSNIADNLLLTPAEETKSRFAWDILKELLTLGNDTTDDRRLLGIYGGGSIQYKTIPTSIEYVHYLSGYTQAVFDQASQNPIDPWKVRPGKWLIVPDYYPSGEPNIADYPRNDPRVKFLESVSYSAPWGLDLSGGRNDPLSQRLAKIAYSGGMY